MCEVQNIHEWCIFWYIWWPEPPTTNPASCDNLLLHRPDPDVQVEPDRGHDVVELQTKSVPEDGMNHCYTPAQGPVEVQGIYQNIQMPGPNETKGEDDMNHYYTTVGIKVKGATQSNQTPSPDEYEFLPAL